MGAVIANDILMDLGLALLEPIVNTQLNPGGPNIGAGVNTVQPGSMVGIYAGAILVVGANGSPTQEAVVVASVTSVSFTATFVNAHQPTDSLTGSTFPSGIPESTIFTQQEVLGYMTDSQQDFLLKVRPVYNVASLSLTVGKKLYPAPADAIRVERASVIDTGTNPPQATELYNLTQTDLDLLSYNWEGAGQGPTGWFQDQINPQSIGFGPPPQVGKTVSLFYSQNAATPLTVLSTFLIPDPMTVAIKWRTLALCFSKDGEQRDPKRAAFAQQLYDLVVLISQKFLAGTDARVRTPDETVEPLAAQRM